MESYDIRKDFKIIENNKIAYLDSGATTQKPTQVIDKIKHYYEFDNANPHRGAYKLSIKATEVYDEAREKVRKFINAPKVEEYCIHKKCNRELKPNCIFLWIK